MTALTTLAPAAPSKRPGPRLAPLEAKRRPPPQRGRLVPRERLVRRLRGAPEVPLALLIAPAGYGKSTVLAQWAEQDVRPFAWLTLDEGDNDPLQLITSIASALDVMKLAPAQNGRGGMLPTLLRSLETVSRSFVLVLDDAHLLDGTESLEVLTALVDHLPLGSQLALAARSQPAMPVGRLRAHRKVVELHYADFAVSPSEAGPLLVGAGAVVEAADAEVLVRRTEGWAAGLYLAALALGGTHGSSPAAEQFGGEDPMFADYVRDEILAELAPRDVSFLTRVSVLELLSGPVCDELLGRSGSARVLSELARSNLPLFPAPGTDCYRLNGLLAQALRAELRRADPEVERELHRRAASWYAGHGDVDSAARHAVAARDPDLTGTILWAHLPGYAAYGRNAVIQRWLAGFSDEEIAAHPSLSLVAAHHWLVSGDRNRAEHWTGAAARGTEHLARSPSLKAGVAVMRAAIAAEGIARMGHEAGRAYALLADDSPWRSSCCLLQGVASHLTGDRDGARRQLEEGARRGAVAAPGVQALCIAQLALLALDEHDWMNGEMLAARARVQVERFGLSEYPGSALVYAVSAAVRAQRGRVDEATIDFRHASALASKMHDVASWYDAEIRVALARAALRLSDVAGARALLSEISRLLRRVPQPTALHAWLDELQARADAPKVSTGGGRWSLTTAELRVLQFLPTHLSFPEIAIRLNVSANTVKTHARAIYRKLDSSSRAEAVSNALDAGLVEIGSRLGAQAV